MAVHSSIHFEYGHPSHWLGFIFLILGVALVVASPKIVFWSLTVRERTNRWLLDLVGYDGKFYLSQNNLLEEEPLQKWRRFSAWSGTLILSAMLITIGVVILQGRM